MDGAEAGGGEGEEALDEGARAMEHSDGLGVHVVCAAGDGGASKPCGFVSAHDHHGQQISVEGVQGIGTQCVASGSTGSSQPGCKQKLTGAGEAVVASVHAPRVG